MSRGCRRAFCEDCGQEMIHRDNRRFYESSSALGQIIWREAPRDFGAGDVDLFIHRSRQKTLLRWVEHKQPGHKFESSQRNSLGDFDRVIRHAVSNPPPGMLLHPDSGVYVLRGKLHVASQMNPHQKVDFGGRQKLTDVNGKELFEFSNREQLYTWMRGLNTCEICGEPGPDSRVQHEGRTDGWVHDECAERESDD